MPTLMLILIRIRIRMAVQPLVVVVPQLPLPPLLPLLPLCFIVCIATSLPGAMGAKCWQELIKMNEGTCHKQKRSQLLTKRASQPASECACGRGAWLCGAQIKPHQSVSHKNVTEKKLHKYFNSLALLAREWRHLSMECCCVPLSVSLCLCVWVCGCCKTSHKLPASTVKVQLTALASRGWRSQVPKKMLHNQQILRIRRVRPPPAG